MPSVLWKCIFEFAQFMSQDLTVSLEPHLAERLQALIPILPPDTKNELNSYLESVTAPESRSSSATGTGSIPYALLLTISKWTRSESGSALVKNTELDVRDYEMISLLAGARSAPEKHFPTPAGGWPTPAELRERDAKRGVTDRQAIAHIINALVSIGGAAAAVWYAAGVAGWQNEWRVLLALLAAFVVAIAEAGIYIIYTTYTTSPGQVKRRQTLLDKKQEPVPDISLDTTAEYEAVSTATDSASQTVRKRIAGSVS